MRNRSALRKLQLVILVKTECKRLNIRHPNDRVMDSWSENTLNRMLRMLKAGKMGQSANVRSNWRPSR